jgi:hypothetical protein
MAKRGRGKKRKGGLKMPLGFVSKKQMRYFFANPKLKAKWAHTMAHRAGMHSAVTKTLGHSPAYQRLPIYKHGPTAKGTRKRFS